MWNGEFSQGAAAPGNNVQARCCRYAEDIRRWSPRMMICKVNMSRWIARIDQSANIGIYLATLMRTTAEGYLSQI